MSIRRMLPLFLLTMFLLAGCSVNPATGRRQLLTLSTSQEIAMGTEAMPQLIEEYGGEVQSAELREYVRRVGSDLLEHVEPEYVDLPWEFTVLDSDVINAFALPGGKVFISRGLLAQFENEAQVAGVLGHEIGHVTAQHIDERITRTMGTEFGLTILGAVTETEFIRQGAAISAQLILQGYSRGQESEADVQGVKYMTAGGYDPLGMMQVLEVLQAAAGGARQPEFLATHPHPETRLATVAELRAGPYAFTRDNDDFRLYRHRFQSGALPYLAPTSAGAFGDIPAASWCGVCRQHAASK